AAAVSLNVLDCVPAPVDLLRSLAQALMPGAKAMLACPYDWAPASTPGEGWLGGHSQRSQDRGASAPVLRALLTAQGHPWSVKGLELLAERDGLAWHVRMHERSTMSYKTHLVVAQKLQDL